MTQMTTIREESVLNPSQPNDPMTNCEEDLAEQILHVSNIFKPYHIFIHAHTHIYIYILQNSTNTIYI